MPIKRIEQKEIDESLNILRPLQRKVNEIIDSPGGADGSETKVNSGSNTTVTGTGTIADPYVINSSGGGGGDVDSVNGQTGVVVLTTANVADSTDKRYVTDSHLTVLGTSLQKTLTAGSNITIDNTNPLVPVISSSGSGSYSEVANYASLPTASTVSGATYAVLATTGNWYSFNKKDAGFYRSNGATWIYLGSIQSYFNDAEFRVQDDVDPTKQVAFNVGANVPTATTRTLTIPSTDGTIALTSQVYTPVNTDTAYVETNGNNATGVVGNPVKPFLTIDAALDALVSVTYAGMEIGQGSFAAPTPAKLRSNLFINGSGKGDFNTAYTQTAASTITTALPTKIVGGTIIQGGFAMTDLVNVKITNLGIDRGTDYITAGGTAGNCIGMGGAGSGNTSIAYPYSIGSGVEIRNVIVLGNSKTSGFHGIVIEGQVNLVVDNCTAALHTHGMAFKNNGGKYTNLTVMSTGTSGIILKGDKYAASYGTILDGFHIGSFNTSNVGAGLQIETGSGSIVSPIVTNGVIRATTFGVATITGQIENLTMSNVEVVGCTVGPGFSILNCFGGGINNCYAHDLTGAGFVITSSANGSFLATSLRAIGCTGNGFTLTGNGSTHRLLASNLFAQFNTGFGISAGTGVYVMQHYEQGNTAGATTGTINTW